MATAISYAAQIKPLFTQMDQQHMIQAKNIDLWNYDDVKQWAQQIYNAVKSGAMPPSGSEPEAPWSADNVNLFKEWMAGGMNP